jgi:hypothetical protein
MSQDESRDANATVVAVGRKGELGANRAYTVARVASSANQGFAILSLRCDHQCDHLAEIHVGQLLELRGRQIFLWAEEASVNRVSIQVLERIQDSVVVIVTDGPNCDRSAILQCLTGSIVLRIHHPSQSMM